MSTRDAIVAEALRWRGTRYQHQQHTRDLATDCGGLIGGVGVAVGALPVDWWETEFAPHAGYSRQPSKQSLERICDAFMERIDTGALEPGDVVGIRWEQEVMHLAFVVPYHAGGLAIVHALQRAGGVVEHRLSDVWRARIALAWRMPGIA